MAKGWRGRRRRALRLRQVHALQAVPGTTECKAAVTQSSRRGGRGRCQEAGSEPAARRRGVAQARAALEQRACSSWRKKLSSTLVGMLAELPYSRTTQLTWRSCAAARRSRMQDRLCLQAERCRVAAAWRAKDPSDVSKEQTCTRLSRCTGVSTPLVTGAGMGSQDARRGLHSVHCSCRRVSAWPAGAKPPAPSACALRFWLEPGSGAPALGARRPRVRACAGASARACRAGSQRLRRARKTGAASAPPPGPGRRGPACASCSSCCPCVRSCSPPH